MRRPTAPFGSQPHPYGRLGADVDIHQRAQDAFNLRSLHIRLSPDQVDALKSSRRRAVPRTNSVSTPSATAFGERVDANRGSEAHARI